MEDECEIYYDMIQTRMEIFHNSFINYNKNKFGCVGSSTIDRVEIVKKLEEEIELKSDLEKKIDYMILDLQNKFKSVTSLIQSFDCKNHKGILHDIETLKSTSNRLIGLYEQKKKENEENIKKLKDSEIYFIHSQGASVQYNSEKIDNSVVDQNVSYIEDYIDNNYNTYSNNLTQENSYNQNKAYQQEYYSLQHSLDIAQKEFHLDTNNLKQINEIKTKIKDLTMSIDKEVIKAKEALIEIDNNVSEYSENIEKTNNELRKAALLKNKNNSIKYPLILGTVLGAAGSFVPGIGNAIGATIGTGVGIALSRIEKKAIKKIEPDKYKD